MLNNNDTITASDLATARRVVRAAGIPEHAADDLVQDAVVAVLSAGGFDPAKGSMSNYLAKTARNLAFNHKKRACNRMSHTVVNGTDFDREDGAPLGAGLILEGPDGREVLARREEISALEALEADERAFVEALALGHTATEAAAAVGWSNAKASRKRKEIGARIGR